MKFLLFFRNIAFFLLLSGVAFGQIKLKTTLDADGVTYKVFAISAQTFTGLNSLISTSQITIVVPHGSGSDYFQLSNISSPVVNMRWTLSARTDAPPENPDYDYLFFSFTNNAFPFVRFNIDANREILLFTFKRTSPCNGKLYAFDNQTDPFRFPNSAGINSGNSLSVLAVGGDVYRGNTEVLPLVNLTLDTPTPCAGAEIIFTASPTISGNYEYQWYVDEKPQGSPQRSTTFKYELPKNELDYQTIISVKLIESGATKCDTYTARTTIKLLVKALPEAKIAFTGTDCVVLPVMISVKSDASIQYQWQENGADISAEKKNTLEVVKSGSYAVKMTKNGCANLSNIQKIVGISLQEKIMVNAGQDMTIVAGQSIKLTGEATNATYYNWSPAQDLSNPKIAQPMARPTETTEYTLTVTNEIGCPTSDAVVVKVLPTLFIPTAFSPNDDGQNDEWKIENINFFPEATIEVYNRWGNTIFFSEGYKILWDGKNAPQAAYNYIIRTKYKTYKGFIELLR